MVEFEYYAGAIQEIEREIARMGIALGIDWNDDRQVHQMVVEAFDHYGDDLKQTSAHPEDTTMSAKVKLFGLAALMLRAMQESADLGIESHGGPIWKTFGRALWAEAERRQKR